MDINDLRGTVLQRFQELTDEEKGIFDKSLDPRIAHLGILGLCNWAARWYEPGGTLPVPELIEMYNKMVLRSLGVQQP